MLTLRKTIRLHQAQSNFCRASALYRGFVGGRGSGKTTAGAYDLIRRSRRNHTYLIASPTSVLMQDTTFPTFEQWARELCVWPGSAGVRMSPYPTVRLTNGATVRFRTAEDPEKLRGPNLSGVWLDEASLMHRNAYLIAIASLREAGEQGWLSATFTPKGLEHWTYDIFGKGRPDTAIFHAATRDNPFNAATFAATMARQYSGAFAEQELEGRFVDESEVSKIIPVTWVRAAMQRWRPGPPSKVPLDAIGIDVARGGSACTVLARRYGSWWAPLEKHPGHATPDGNAVVSLISLALRENPLALVSIDAIGVGSSPLDACRRDLGHARILPVYGGNSAQGLSDRTGTLRFVNVRAYAWWSLRDLLDPAAGFNIQLPPDDELLADLVAPKFEMTAGGIKVESKADLIDPKRLGRSPDCGDAVVYSVLLPPGGIGMVPGRLIA